jgi:hypothetical protein
VFTTRAVIVAAVVPLSGEIASQPPSDVTLAVKATLALAADTVNVCSGGVRPEPLCKVKLSPMTDVVRGGTAGRAEI